MTRSALERPAIEPTPIFELFRGSYATELLTAAVAHFDVFERLAVEAKSAAVLAAEIGLAARPAVVLFTALRAMQLLATDGAGKFALTPIAREHLLRAAPFFVGDYVGLAAQAPGVVHMAKLLRNNGPERREETAFIFRSAADASMEAEASARHLTLALAGRAKNVAPFLADAVDAAGAKTLLDLGGGTGIYSIALVQKHPHLKAVVFDRPEVLKVAAEMAAEYGVAERIELVPGDMFTDPLPSGVDLVLLSNILHDWDLPECRTLLGRSAAALADGGRVLIQDVFLNDALDGPLPIALYSAALFSLTEGRAYSAAEYRALAADVGLVAGEVRPTAVHCGVLDVRKR
jgi:predicted O-methyltransferase YrrM